MLDKLIAIGLAKEQAEKVIRDLGIETIDDLKHLKETDLTDLLGIKPIPARRILAAAGVTPSGVSGPQEITVKFDKGDRVVSEIDEPEDLLAVVVSTTRPASDRKAAARKLADMGRKVVVSKENRKELRADDTVVYWRRGSLTSRFWGRDHHPVVSATTLFESDEKVEIDPFELVNGRRLVALDSGYNAESGADWAKVTMPRRALLIAAALEGEAVANGDSVTIAEALSAETLTGKWRVLESRADAERLTELQRHLCVPLIDIDTPDSAGASVIMVAIFGAPTHSPATPVRGLATVSTGDVETFLRTLFSNREMAGMADAMSPGLSDELPDGGAARAEYAHQFVRLMKGHGFLNSLNFWQEVFRQRGNGTHRSSVYQMAQQYGVTL